MINQNCGKRLGKSLGNGFFPNKVFPRHTSACSPYQETRDVDIATITGVGSSALGSAALAWDISVALEKPVLGNRAGLWRR
jgi:hypothetical protein